MAETDAADEATEQRYRDAIERSCEVFGAAAGGAIGLIGGPIGSIGGAAAGAALTRTLQRVGLEVYERVMVRRQRERVGLVLGFSDAEARRHQEEGDQVRADGFFDADAGQRSAAEELTEAVLLQAANAYEERKLRHLGAIVPSLATRPDVSLADGHWLTRLAERLSWRQFKILSLFMEPPGDAFSSQAASRAEGPTPGLSEEVEELSSLGLLGIAAADGRFVGPGVTLAGVATIWMTPQAEWGLTDRGRLLAEVLRLDQVPDPERQEVLAQLTE